MNDRTIRQQPATSLRQDISRLLRYWLSQRRIQLVLAAVLIGMGAWFNWDWLVAAGFAPLILAIAPCALMCLMGLCMHKSHGKKSADDVKASDASGGSSTPDL